MQKTVIALGFILCIISFRRYDWAGCAVLAPIPFLAAFFGGIGAGKVFLRSLAALPFVLCAGIANCFFDRTPAAVGFGEIMLPGGVIALAVLILKTLGAVGMALTLSAATPFSEIAGVLHRFHVPCLLVLQLQLTFRYLGVLTGEAGKMLQGYFLRAPGRRMVRLSDAGGLCGRLFLRATARGEAIYQAMQCRLFHAGVRMVAPERTVGTARRCLEWGITVFCLLFFVAVRRYV